jgi:hypothetical protein
MQLIFQIFSFPVDIHNLVKVTTCFYMNYGVIIWNSSSFLCLTLSMLLYPSLKSANATCFKLIPLFNILHYSMFIGRKVSNNVRYCRQISRSMTNSSKPVDHWSFLSPLAAARQQSPTRALMPFMKIPGMINLGTGLPNAEYVRMHQL